MPKLLALRVAEEAQADIVEIAQWTERIFGPAAAERYSSLIEQALADLTTSPTRLGAQESKRAAETLWTYHLNLSRDRVVGPRVQTPRHLLLYRFDQQTLTLLRVLHERRDLPRHIVRASSPRKGER